MDDMTREKLVLLYIIRQAPGILLSDVLSTALGTLTSDYFTLAQAMTDLGDSDLIRLEPVAGTGDCADARGHLTEAGKRALDALPDQIPEGTRNWIDRHLSETGIERAERESIRSEYRADGKGGFVLECAHLSERGDGFFLSLDLPTEALARRAHFAFRRDPAKLYATLVETLLGDDHPS